MTDTDRPRFAQLLLALSETFNEPVSDTRLDVYFNTLSDFDIAAVEHAAHQLLRSSTFFPKPAEFVTLLEGDIGDQGELALARISEEVRRVGYYGRPRLSEADTELVRRVWGGWESLCASLPAKGTSEFQWERKRFLEYHHAAQTQHRAPMLTKGEATGLLDSIKTHAEVAREHAHP